LTAAVLSVDVSILGRPHAAAAVTMLTSPALHLQHEIAIIISIQMKPSLILAADRNSCCIDSTIS